MYGARDKPGLAGIGIMLADSLEVKEFNEAELWAREAIPIFSSTYSG